jgi:parallel beta-helix repeat protein
MSETVPIQVTSYGTLAAGAGPHYKLVVDGTVVGDATVGTQSQTNSFSTTLASGQPHDVQIVYDNDTVVGNDDRNLYLQSITVNGQTIPATDPTEVYHATSGPGDIPSNGNMYWGGTAEFSLPASDFPSASPPTSTSGPAAFYVSSTGSDRNDGSASHPFATLGAAQAAMEGSSIKLTYVEGGTYTLSSPLVLGQADSGMTFQSAPGQTATLNGQNVSNLIDISGASGVTLSGLSFENTGDAAVLLNNGASGNNVVGNDFESNGTGVRVISSNSNTISGNQIDNSGHAGIEVQDGASKNTVDSNLINGVSATGTTGGGIFLHGTSSNTISHNQVENTAGFGIGVLNWDGSTVNTGDVVTDNELLNTGTASNDTGSIYVLGRSDIDTGITISNNYIDGTGPTSAHIVGIYLDDYTSGVTVDNNILRNIGTHGLEIHGGHDNNVYNNVFDLGTITKSAALFQAEAGDPGSAGAQNNSFHQNIITSSQANQYNYDSIDGATANIYGNLYYDPAGSFIGGLNASLVQDSNPSYGNPAFQNPAGGNYALGSGSAAGSINFQQINQGSIGLQPTTAHWYA